ncbi:serine/threonine-protein kinase Sgk1-like isoform X1 [Biomphalaria pfeifferi]|uniref:Serine/threonine-protein kinase Sgk1-like isoform X1 n=1 Tax=Biomphalaria pfeifferi TaxID=112525 RepID=A0AAD8CBM3_BIOPF|nr:serine/threonine-protein kinase Sgk1-like isoform X1 [Biomphalaria pfeifferi]
MSRLLVPQPDNQVKSAPSSPQIRKSEHHTFSFHHKKSDSVKNGKKSEHQGKKSGHKSVESSLPSLCVEGKEKSKTLSGQQETPGLKKSSSTGNGLNKLINKFITPQVRYYRYLKLSTLTVGEREKIEY